MGGISWVAEELSASQEDLCSMELVKEKERKYKRDGNWIMLFV